MVYIGARDQIQREYEAQKELKQRSLRGTEEEPLTNIRAVQEAISGLTGKAREEALSRIRYGWRALSASAVEPQDYASSSQAKANVFQTEEGVYVQKSKAPITVTTRDVNFFESQNFPESVRQERPPTQAIAVPEKVDTVTLERGVRRPSEDYTASLSLETKEEIQKQKRESPIMQTRSDLTENYRPGVVSGKGRATIESIDRPFPTGEFQMVNKPSEMLENIYNKQIAEQKSGKNPFDIFQLQTDKWIATGSALQNEGQGLKGVLMVAGPTLLRTAYACLLLP